MTGPRITQLLVAALAIGLPIWVAMNTYWADVTVDGSLEGEAATNPFYSTQHLAAALGMHSELIASLSSPVPRGGVLLISGIQNDLFHSRVESLTPWVESGGRLVVTGDVVWASAALQVWSGVAPGSRLVENPAKRPAVSRPPAPRPIEPDSDCAPLAVKIDGTATGETLTYCGPQSQNEFVSKRVPAWSLSSEHGMQMLRVALGHGSVTVIPRGWLIGNKNLVRRDHAEIFIAAADLRRGDRLYILNVTSAETLLALLWRLIAPAILLFGIAILCIIARHLPRFGPPTPIPTAVRRSLAEQIRANAAFAWRTGKLAALRTAVGRALDEAAGRRIAGYRTLALRRRASAIADLSGADLKSLSAAMSESAAAGAPVQRAAIALLEQSRRFLKARTQPPEGRA